MGFGPPIGRCERVGVPWCRESWPSRSRPVRPLAGPAFFAPASVTCRGRDRWSARSPVPIPSSAQQHHRPVDVDIEERGGTYPPGKVENHSREQHAVLKQQAREIVQVAKAVRRVSG
jgi:hypothetical protein